MAGLTGDVGTSKIYLGTRVLGNGFTGTQGTWYLQLTRRSVICPPDVVVVHQVSYLINLMQVKYLKVLVAALEACLLQFLELHFPRWCNIDFN